MVASAGNEGDAGMGFPAAYEPVVSVGADGQVASSTVVRVCASKASPDNASAAPFQYHFQSGTSFSGPAVAGVVARMLERNPGLSNSDAAIGALNDPASWGPGELERRLEASATPLEPGTVTVTHRTGVPLVETWGVDAIGHGWVFADDAVNAAG